MNKKYYPKATKTSLIKMLREMGQDIPSSRGASFSSVGHSFWLRWHDSGGTYHVAYYTGSAGRPVLQIDKSWPKFTLADAICHGMVEEVKEKKK